MDSLIVGLGIAGGLKVAGSAVKVAEDLLLKLLGPAAEEAGQALADPVRAWHVALAERGRNFVNVANQTHEMLDAAQMEAGPVPLKTLLPIVEHASLESEPDLARRWAALLANAASRPDAVHPSFCSILAELSSADAGYLEMLNQETVPEGRQMLPYREFRAKAMGALNLNELQADLSFLSLERQGFCRTISTGSNVNSIERSVTIAGLEMTKFGRAFVAACQPPQGP